jgi:hypothetical protein
LHFLIDRTARVGYYAYRKELRPDGPAAPGVFVCEDMLFARTLGAPPAPPFNGREQLQLSRETSRETSSKHERGGVKHP